MAAEKIHVTGTPWGPFNLVLQDAPPDDKTFLGYVDHGDGKLQCSFWMNDCWNSRNLKPLSREVVAWYRMEKPDGSRLF